LKPSAVLKTFQSSSIGAFTTPSVTWGSSVKSEAMAAGGSLAITAAAANMQTSEIAMLLIQEFMFHCSLVVKASSAFGRRA
jgi:hypothetical protein